MFKDLKYNMQEATSNANFPWAEKCLNAADWFPLILSDLVDAFPQAKGFFFHLLAVTRLEDYFQMVIIWLSAARTTQFADVNVVGYIMELGGVRKCAPIQIEVPLLSFLEQI